MALLRLIQSILSLPGISSPVVVQGIQHTPPGIGAGSCLIRLTPLEGAGGRPSPGVRVAGRILRHVGSMRSLRSPWMAATQSRARGPSCGHGSGQGRTRTSQPTFDPLLRRSFHAAGQPAAFLIRAGLLIFWLQLNVSGFRPVLARGWHAARCLRAGDYSLVR